jgi:hypothetical protein
LPRPRKYLDQSQVKHLRQDATFSEQDYLKIERMAGLGLNAEMVAAILGISRDAFMSRLKKDATAQARWAEGIAKANAQVAETLFSMAVSGKHPVMTIFWAKTRMGFSEKIRVDFTSVEPEKIDSPEVREVAARLLPQIRRLAAIDASTFEAEPTDPDVIEISSGAEE